jgi:hypothetical protein
VSSRANSDAPAVGPRKGAGAEHRVAGLDAGHVVTEGVDRASDLETDTTRQVAGEQAAAEGPVRWGQPAGLDRDADLAGARAGRLAIAAEAVPQSR